MSQTAPRTRGAHSHHVLGVRLGAVGEAVERDVNESGSLRQAGQQAPAVLGRRPLLRASQQPARRSGMRRRWHNQGQSNRHGNHHLTTVREQNVRSFGDAAFSPAHAWGTAPQLATRCSRTLAHRSSIRAAILPQLMRGRAETRASGVRACQNIASLSKQTACVVPGAGRSRRRSRSRLT
jgi:hypothetical protein